MANVLLIDDEPDVLAGWALMLKPLKHHVVTAIDEENALAACAETRFDLVVADYVVGTSVGVRIIHRIRKKLPLVRTILISGRFEKNLTEGELKAIVKERVEVDEYLHKPVGARVFREKVSALLETKTPEWKEIVRRAKIARQTADSAVDEVEHKLKRHLKKD